MTRKNDTRGFTLLEVLIAVLILGIIATAALPMLGSYTEKAREAAQDAQAASCNAAVDRYGVDHQYGAGSVVGYEFADAFAAQDYALRQLTKPTDGKGNVMGDPMTADPGPYAYGPYITDTTLAAPQPASLVLAAAGVSPGRYVPAPEAWTIIVDDGGAKVTYALSMAREGPNLISAFTAKFVVLNNFSETEIERAIYAFAQFSTTLSGTKLWRDGSAPALVCALTALIIPAEGSPIGKAVAESWNKEKDIVKFIPEVKYVNAKSNRFHWYNQVDASEKATLSLMSSLANQTTMRGNPALYNDILMATQGGHESSVALLNNRPTEISQIYASFGVHDKTLVVEKATTSASAKNAFSDNEATGRDQVLTISGALRAVGAYVNQRATGKPAQMDWSSHGFNPYHHQRTSFEKAILEGVPEGV